MLLWTLYNSVCPTQNILWFRLFNVYKHSHCYNQAKWQKEFFFLKQFDLLVEKCPLFSAKALHLTKHPVVWKCKITDWMYRMKCENAIFFSQYFSLYSVREIPGIKARLKVKVWQTVMSVCLIYWITQHWLNLNVIVTLLVFCCLLLYRSYLLDKCAYEDILVNIHSGVECKTLNRLFWKLSMVFCTKRDWNKDCMSIQSIFWLIHWIGWLHWRVHQQHNALW